MRIRRAATQASQIVWQCWMTQMYCKPGAAKMNRLAVRFGVQIILNNLALPIDFLLASLVRRSRACHRRRCRPSDKSARAFVRSPLGRRR